MPELPEVFTLATNLNDSITNKVIESVKVFVPKSIKNIGVRKISTDLSGDKVKEVTSYGKYLLVKTNKHWIEFHPRMEGKVDFNEDDKYSIMRINFNDGTVANFRDHRKFATVNIHDGKLSIEELPFREKVGSLPWDTDVKELYESVKNKRTPIKATLLDQKYLVGIGNIYADEILYASGISPLRITNDVSFEEWKVILKESKRILTKAKKSLGTTIRTYSSIGKPGKYQNYLEVHTKEGMKTSKGGTVVKIKVGGRGTYYDPQNQK